MSKKKRTIETTTEPMLGTESKTNEPIGIPCLERLLPEGQLSSGVHSLLAPTGSGRTTLGAMIAAAGALREFKNGEEGGESRPWIFVNGSSNDANVRAKMIAQAANAPVDAILPCLFISNESETPFTVDIERLPPEFHVISEGEEESAADRIQRVAQQLDGMLQVIKLDKVTYKKDFGPVDAIRHHIKNDPACQNGVAGIVIDDIELLIDKFRQDCKVTDERAFSSLMSGFVKYCRYKLSTHLNCAVWLTHTIAGGRVNKRFRDIDHKDAAETRHFGDNLDVCLVMGNKNQDGEFPVKVTKAPQGLASLEIVSLTFDPKSKLIREATPQQEKPICTVSINERDRVRLRQMITEKNKSRSSAKSSSNEETIEKQEVTSEHNLEAERDEVIDENDQVQEYVIPETSEEEVEKLIINQRLNQ